MTVAERTPVTSPDSDSRAERWFGPMLLRLHFYAGILVGPFILVAALTGAAYALTPSIEQVVYDRQLHAPVAADVVPLTDQILAAQGFIGARADGGYVDPVAVRPAPKNGDTTRVMFADGNLLDGQTRAIFIDPATAEVRGDLPVYGTSGALPLRTTIDQLHRSLGLGDAGRLYSELAASWLGVVVVAGFGLWMLRWRASRRKNRSTRELVRPVRGATGYRRIHSWHASTGIWLLAGALFLSATGITWSQFGGQSVTDLRAAAGWSTPALSTALTDTGPGESADPHAGHSSSAGAVTVDPGSFGAVLAVAQTVNVNTGNVEIVPPADGDAAWTVTEIKRSFPTEVDAVAIDGRTLRVVDRSDFADYPLVAKLARWGIDTHMGALFGLPNQVLLVATALGIAAMVVFGYLMWWKRRPTGGIRRRLAGRPPRAGALTRAPWWGIVLLIAAGGALGVVLPLIGISLVAFILFDALLTVATTRAVP